jgi:hypothetical protein
MSKEANEELADLQSAIIRADRDITLSDKWSYVWGQENYKVHKFYEFYFRDVTPDPCLPLI